MAGIRCFHEGPLPDAGETLALGAEESHHLSTVLRLRRGASVEVLDGDGAVAQAQVTRAERRLTVVRVCSLERRRRRQCALALAQALPKGKTMDGLVRGVTEIGIDALQPLTSQHCEVRLEGERAAGKQARWRSAAIEALKQCGLPFLPEIRPVRAFSEWVDALPRPGPGDLRLCASLEPDRPLLLETLAGLEALPASVTVLVGPEGDFSAREYAAADEAGFRPVRLGANVLRVETAALYSLSVVDQWLSQQGAPATRE